LQNLVRKNILSSAKGPAGGFYIPPGRELFLIDIIRATDGDSMFTSCVLGLHQCSAAQPCPMHHQVKPIRDMLLAEFSKQPLTTLATDLGAAKYFLK
jgi:DNA-binding IscR family transcriptional regulator